MRFHELMRINLEFVLELVSEEREPPNRVRSFWGLALMLVANHCGLQKVQGVKLARTVIAFHRKIWPDVLQSQQSHDRCCGR
jgi:hypothetical protein